MTITVMTGARPWLAAGWTMLHFLWVGGALGLVAAVGRRTLRAARPEVRYGFALSCLAALSLAPAAIVVLLMASAEPEPARAVPPTITALVPIPSSGAMPGLTPPVALPASRMVIDRSAPIRLSDARQWERLVDLAVAGLPWFWLCGAPATFALVATGLVGAERLRRASRPLIVGELAEIARRLAATLGIARPVALAICDRLIAPVLIGVVRPLILLPPAALTGWSAEQVEMVLLHELAHVRRLDNLVNLGQRMVESVLFFHPVVWWVSGWVRLEREHCCDRLVVARTGRARPYAELLAALAVPGSRPGRASVAMTESPVVARIRRILNLEDHSMRLSRPVIAFAAALLIAPAVLIASQAAAPGRSEGAKPEPAAPPSQKNLDRARIDDVLRRARHGADMFKDVQGRAHSLSQIAAAQARLGDRNAARQTFRDAVAIGETVSLDDSYYSPHILLWIARSQARSGFRDEAIETLRRLLRLAEAPVKREIGKSDLYTNILTVQVESGDRAGVQETLRLAHQFYTTSKDTHITTFAPQSLVLLQAMSGDLAGALRMVDDPELFKDPNPRNVRNLRHTSQFSIVREISASNHEGADTVLDAARRSLEARHDEMEWMEQAMRNQDREAIAVAQARLGRFDEARKMASAINAETLPGQLAESARADYLDGQRFHKAGTFATIAEAQIEVGDRDGARQSARDAIKIVATIQGLSYKTSPFWRVIQALARAGEAAEALRIVDAMSPQSRVMNYETVARAQREAGDEAGARKTFDSALKLVRDQIATTQPVKPDRSPSAYRERNQLLNQAVHLQAELGDVKGAIATARGINAQGEKIEAMKGLAANRAAVGDLDGAMAAVGEINAPKSEAEALEAIAVAIARRTGAPER